MWDKSNVLFQSKKVFFPTVKKKKNAKMVLKNWCNSMERSTNKSQDTSKR